VENHAYGQAVGVGVISMKIIGDPMNVREITHIPGVHRFRKNVRPTAKHAIKLPVKSYPVSIPGLM
jgi:hypothetical protein